MRMLRDVGIFLGAVPTLLGIASYGILRIFPKFLEEYRVIYVFLISAAVIVSSSYYFKRKFDYLTHGFFFFCSIALFLLAIVDLFNIMRWIFPGFISSESLILPVFEKVLEGVTDNLRYFLSATAQSLAALFAILFSLIFISAQLYTHLYEASQARYVFKKLSTYFLILLYISFISYNLFLLTVIPTNVDSEFVALSFLGTLLCLFLLIPYLMSITVELDPEIITRMILSEAKRGNDDNKFEAVKRIVSNMKHWYRNGKKNQFTFAKLKLDDFLTEIEDGTDGRILEHMKSTVEFLDDIIKKDNELKLLIWEQNVKYVKEKGTEKDAEPRIMRCLDFYKDYILTDSKMKKRELQLSTRSLIELAQIVPDPEKILELVIISFVREGQLPEKTGDEEDLEASKIKAANLNSLGAIYWSQKNSKRAKESFNEALEIYRELAKKEPDTHVPNVAGMYNSLGHLYRNLREFEKAEESYNEALEIYRELAKKEPDTYVPNVAGMYNSRGHLYRDSREFEKAEESYNEALEIYRELAKKEPDTHKAGVAITLNYLGNLYRDSREFEKAEESHDKSLEIYEKLVEEKCPGVNERTLAGMLNDVGNLYWNLAEFEKSEESYNEALKIYKRLAEKDPVTYEPDITTTLSNLGNLYWNLGDFKKLEKSYNEALKIYKRLAEKDPVTYEPNVAVTLSQFGDVLRYLGKSRKSSKSYNKALKIYKRLVEKDPVTYEPKAAGICGKVGDVYVNLRKFGKAKESYNEALEIYKTLVERDFITYGLDRADTLKRLGYAYRNLREFEKARESFNEALRIYRELAKLLHQGN